jgi:hypothetical protein
MDPVWVSQTTFASIVVQALVGIVDIYGTMLKVPPREEVLIDVLKIETLVQTVQFAMYIYIYKKMVLSTMAVDRYKDWFISTPLMLFTTMLYFSYNRTKEKITITSFVKQNQKVILQILFFNFLMLLFGLLGELNYISLTKATTLGFMAYGVSFYLVYKHFVEGVPQNKPLFNFFALIWGLYGVVYWLPVVEKNVAFNGLDILAKNFFGIYLFYLVYKVKI